MDSISRVQICKRIQCLATGYNKLTLKVILQKNWHHRVFQRKRGDTLRGGGQPPITEFKINTKIALFSKIRTA